MTFGPHTRLFVYGSLLRGEEHHPWLRGATFRGLAATEPRFTLYDLGAFPGMVAQGDYSVVGELYDVDATLLASLDELEQHPGVYFRSPVPLVGGDNAQAYLLTPSQVQGCIPIKTGDWRQRPANQR